MRRTALRVIPVLILSALPKLVFGQPSTFVQIPLPRYASCIFFEAVPTAMNNRNQVVGHTGPVCDECCFAGRREFLWDPAGGLQYLDLQSDGYLGIDDTGVIWFQRCEGGTCRPLKWVDGAVSEQPMPPGARSTSILKVLRNGIVLVSTVQTDGRRTSWSFDKGTYTDLEALTGARIWTMNQQGALGGCRLLDVEGRAGRPYLRFPNGRVIEPWQTACQTWWNIGSSGVTVLGAGGHFAGIGLTQDGVPVVPTGSLPNEQHAYYGTPDERIWTTGPQRNWTFPLDMNNVGTLLLGSFTFREGTLTDLKQITSH